jgi:predicted small secreted protein
MKKIFVLSLALTVMTFSSCNDGNAAGKVKKAPYILY